MNLIRQRRSLFSYYIYAQKRKEKFRLTQFSIMLDVAYKIKYIGLAMEEGAEAAKCLLTGILWVTADVRAADVFHLA